MDRPTLQRLIKVFFRRGFRAVLFKTRRNARVIGLLLAVTVLAFLLVSLGPITDLESIQHFACVVGLQRFLGKRLPNVKCNVYPLRRYNKETFDCLPLPTIPSPIICIHDVKVDRYISGAIKEGTVWEAQNVRIFQYLLEQNAHLGVIDVGANIGQYSLLAASMGRPVVAVEPYIKHVQMIQKAVALNNLYENFTLVHNAVSDSAKFVTLQLNKDNRGAIRVIESELQNFLNEQTCTHSEASARTITMNDLVEVTTFAEALLKIDIEGYEAKAMMRSGLFMEKLHVPYILMEWVILRKAQDEWQVQNVQDLVDYMLKYDYEAWSTNLQPLNMTATAWLSWPQDILWKLATVEFA